MEGTRFEHDFYADPYSHRHFDPASSSIGEDRHPLLRNRAPQAIPLHVSGSGGTGHRQQGRRLTHREGKSGSRHRLGDQADKGQRTGTDVPLLAPLWMALGEVSFWG